MNPPLRAEQFTLGLVGPPFGLKGFVKIHSFSGETEHFSRLGEAVLRLGGRETTWNIAETVPLGNSLIIRFAGIESPEAARQLQGAEIIAPRAGAAPLKEGEYYVEDLKGLEVVNSEGCPLGCVTGVVEGGGASLAEVQLLSGESRLVPFRNEFFGDVDFTDRRITLLESWILE